MKAKCSTLLSAPIIRMLTCTGGARPLVARARAPVSPSLVTPLLVPQSSLETVSLLVRNQELEWQIRHLEEKIEVRVISASCTFHFNSKSTNL